MLLQGHVKFISAQFNSAEEIIPDANCECALFKRHGRNETGTPNSVHRLGSDGRILTDQNYEVGITHGVLLSGVFKLVFAEEIIQTQSATVGSEGRHLFILL